MCASHAAPAQTRHVVILYDERVDLPGLAAIDRSLVGTLTAGTPTRLEIYREQLDLSRFDIPGYLGRLRDFLKTKYESRNIDVVVAVMGPALEFALEYRNVVFPGAAIVFSGIDRRELHQRVLAPYVTGVMIRREFRPTAELALRLQPRTKHLFVVGGASDFDTRLMRQIRQEFRGLEARVGLSYLTELPMHALLQKLAHLPPNSIVLYSTMFRDVAGETFVPHEAAERIARGANAPVYAFVDQYIGRGVVGGTVYSIQEHGGAAGRLVLQILSGREPASLPFVESASSHNIFDWRQLRRWGISTARLPAGSDVRFRQPNAWDQYRWYIIGALAVAAIQALIILRLILEQSRRHQSEKRYTLASIAGGVSVWDWNLATDQLYVGPRLKTLLGYDHNEVGTSRSDWLRLIHDDDAAAMLARAKDVIEGKAPTFEAEHRMYHKDGTSHWFLTRGSIMHRIGRAVRITGTITDITERKQSEQALDDVRTELTRVSRLTALGEFSASIAHEVRQPLTSILLNAQTCLRWLRTSTPDLNEIDAALVDVIEASQRAEQLIQRNRALFKLHAVRKDPVDINGLIRDTALLARPRLQACHVRLLLSLSPTLPTIVADRVELQQVVLNLISNVIDATQQLPPDRRRLEIRTSLTLGMNVQVCVKDNGVGLDGVDMKQLFKLSYTTKATGTGIGLSLCRSIVEAHGGRMWAQPNAGPGASFLFTIPVPVAAESEAAVPATTAGTVS